MNKEKRRTSKSYKNLKVIKSILDAINLIEYNLDKDCEDKEWHYNIGQLEALETFYNKKLKTIYDEIKLINIELKEQDDDLELFEMHNQYLRGYHDGCVKIIQLNRQHKEYISDVRILVYVEDDGLKELLIALFSMAGFENDEALHKDSSVCVSSNAKLLSELSNMYDCFKFVVSMSPVNNATIKLENDEKRVVNEIKSQLSSTYKITHSKEDRLFESIKMLGDEWLDANFVYMSSLMSVEQVFSLMISSMRIKY